MAAFLLNLAHPSYAFNEQGQLIGGQGHKETTSMQGVV